MATSAICGLRASCATTVFPAPVFLGGRDRFWRLEELEAWDREMIERGSTWQVRQARQGDARTVQTTHNPADVSPNAGRAKKLSALQGRRGRNSTPVRADTRPGRRIEWRVSAANIHQKPPKVKITQSLVAARDHIEALRDSASAVMNFRVVAETPAAEKA